MATTGSFTAVCWRRFSMRQWDAWYVVSISIFLRPFLSNNTYCPSGCCPPPGVYEPRGPRRSYRKSEHKLSRAHAGRPVYCNQDASRKRQGPKSRGLGTNRRSRRAPPRRWKVRYDAHRTTTSLIGLPWSRSSLFVQPKYAHLLQGFVTNRVLGIPDELPGKKGEARAIDNRQ